MVKISFIGRTCNNLFQYVMGRLLAEKHGLRLVTEWKQQDFISMTQPKDGKVIEQTVHIDDTFKRATDLSILKNNYHNVGISLRGYFQHYSFYDGRLEQIKSWMILPQTIPGHENDIALHVRLDDYEKMTGQPIINQSWYENVCNLQDNRGKRIYIVVDMLRYDWEKKYIDKLTNCLRGRTVEMITQTAAQDFHFIRSFGTIICSNSSFAWWAARLSNAKKVYTFARWLRGCPYVKLAEAEGFAPVDGEYLR